jgi:hypothetical protein
LCYAKHWNGIVDTMIYFVRLGNVGN